MASVNLIKMNGLGNDFLICDARKQMLPPNFFSSQNIVNLSNRTNPQTGGCDQFIAIETISGMQDADIYMGIYNSDGSEVFACGNATRCVVSLLAKEFGRNEITVKTRAAILHGTLVGDANVSVNMGAPVFEWQKIPLASDVDIKNLPIDIENFSRPFAVSMGNPHMVFTTDKDVESINVLKLGTELEYHPLFPELANVGFAQIVDESHMNLRVFERGAGETLACGTGACAAVVAAISRGFCRSPVNVNARGGNMVIEWGGDNSSPVIMTGPVVFEQEITANC